MIIMIVILLLVGIGLLRIASSLKASSTSVESASSHFPTYDLETEP